MILDSKCYNFYLILSDNYIKIYNNSRLKQITNTNIIDLTSLKSIIDNIANNGINNKKIPEIHLIGIDNEDVFNNIAIPINEYIYEKNYVIYLILQLNEFIPNEEQLKILNKCSYNYNFYFTNSIKQLDINKLKIITNYKHNIQITYTINLSNLNNIFNDYINLINIGVQNISLEIDNTINWNTRQLIQISSEFYKIQTIYINQFNHNCIGIIPIELKEMLLKKLMQNYNTKKYNKYIVYNNKLYTFDDFLDTNVLISSIYKYNEILNNTISYLLSNKSIKNNLFKNFFWFNINRGEYNVD